MFSTQIVTLMAVICLVSSTFATTYYVDGTNGSNDANGLSLETAWKTIQKAANTMQAGDTVKIRAGTYNECVVIYKSGTSNNPITYQSYGGEQVTIVASTFGDGGKTCMEILASYIIVSDLYMTGGTNPQGRGIRILAYITNLILDNLVVDNCQYGILFCQVGSLNCTVKNCTIRDSVNSGNQGIIVKCKTKGLLIENNHIYNIGTDQVLTYSYGIVVSGNNDSGVKAIGDDKPSGITIRNNNIHDTSTYCIAITNSNDCVVEDNICYNTGATGIQVEGFVDQEGRYRCRNFIVRNNSCFNCSQGTTVESGIWIHETDNAVVENNIMHASVTGLYVTNSNNVISRNNVIYNNARCGIVLQDYYDATTDAADNVVVHNTVYSNGYDQTNPDIPVPQVSINSCWNMCHLAAYNVLRTRFKNNILAEDQSGEGDLFVSGTTNILDYNTYYHSQRELVIWWDPNVKNVFLHPDQYSWEEYLSVSGQDANSINEDPNFINPDSGNPNGFYLSSDSPCIDNGGFLTYTANSAQDSNSIEVDDARYFCDGYGLVDGDWIQINDNIVQVTDVNYIDNIITIDRNISWNQGDGVSYPYAGTAPDMGAYEYYDCHHYRFDETNGLIAYDSTTGNPYNGVLINGPFWRPNDGVFGGALYFDGENDYVKISDPNYYGISGTHARTVSVWFKTRSPVWQPGGSMSYNLPLVQWGHNENVGQLWMVYLREDRKASVAVASGGVYGSKPLNDGLWHNIVAVLEEGETDPNNIKLYVDGELDATPYNYPGTVINTNTENMPVHIGARCWYNNGNPYIDNYAQGLMDDVRIYQVAWDANTVEAYYKSARVAQLRGEAVVYYNCDEGYDSTLNDCAWGDPNNGTLYNGAGWSTAGAFGKAVSFDGVNDYAKIVDPNYCGISGAHARSVSVWFKTSAPVWPGGSTSYNLPLVQWGHNENAGQLWMVYLREDRKASVAVAGGGVYGSTALNNGIWHNLIAVLPEGETDPRKIKLYVDGQLDATGYPYEPVPVINTNTYGMPVHIGARCWYNNGNPYIDHYAQGLIDEVRIFDKALTEDDVQIIYKEFLN